MSPARKGKAHVLSRHRRTVSRTLRSLSDFDGAGERTASNRDTAGGRFRGGVVGPWVAPHPGRVLHQTPCQVNMLADSPSLILVDAISSSWEHFATGDLGRT